MAVRSSRDLAHRLLYFCYTLTDEQTKSDLD
jgi:hypothetical protein